jgi:catalase
MGTHKLSVGAKEPPYNATTLCAPLDWDIPMPLPLPYTDTIEQPPADEGESIARIMVILREMLQQQLKRSGLARRDVHVKSHGSAAGEFEVLADLPAELAQGLFAEPRTYPAFVRFSNSAPWPQPDAVPDGRGFAVQVQYDLTSDTHRGELGRTQDFVMVNHPVFIARDVKDYLRLEEARLQATQQPLRLAVKILSSAWNPLHWRWRAILAAAQVAGQAASHPANYTYYSMVPFRFGRYVAKCRLVPLSPQPSSLLGKLATIGWQVNVMRQLLVRTLAREEIKFHFQVQLRTSEQSMPIEDATVEWPESESPYRTVAQLVLPRQDISQDRNRDEGERRAFNVWNALIDHRPLGGINRVRRQAYALSSTLRKAPALR